MTITFRAETNPLGSDLSQRREATMSEPNNKKLRIIKLLEILLQDSDLDNPIGTNDLCKRLSKVGVTTDRRTIAKDIAFLNEQGYEIMQTKISRQNAFYIEDRSFSLPELKILIDAVQAASFITEKKTEDLIKKIAALSGSHQAEILTDNIIHFNTRKHTNEHIYYNVNTLEQCIRYKKKASFKYFDLDENRDKEYRKDGEKYITEPVALVFINDNYYLMTYDKTAENEIKNYRVDRMDSVEMLDNGISKKAGAKIDKVSQYTEQVFRMYGGKTEKLSLVFSKKLIGQVYDKFGEKTDITKDGDCYSADVEVQISTTFWSWVAQFKGQMRVAGPKELAIEYEEWIKSIKN